VSIVVVQRTSGPNRADIRKIRIGISIGKRTPPGPDRIVIGCSSGSCTVSAGGKVSCPSGSPGRFLVVDRRGHMT